MRSLLYITLNLVWGPALSIAFSHSIDFFDPLHLHEDHRESFCVCYSEGGGERGVRVSLSFSDHYPTLPPLSETMLMGHLVEGLYRGIPPQASVPVAGGGGSSSSSSSSSNNSRDHQALRGVRTFGNTTTIFAQNSPSPLSSFYDAYKMGASLQPSSWLGPYPRGSGCSPSEVRKLDVSVAVDAGERVEGTTGICFSLFSCRIPDPPTPTPH